MKSYSIVAMREALQCFKDTKYGYPEWFEDGRCTWDCDGFKDITERDMEKLINDGFLSYSPYDDKYVPSNIYDERTAGWLI